MRREVMARRLVLGTLGGAAVASLVAPRMHPRREADFLRVELSATVAGGRVAIFLRVRNVHPVRRRVYTAWVDVSESVARAGRLALVSAAVPARWVPIARAWRLPFDEEIAPGESRDLGMRIESAVPGRYEGHVDVVLDGTSWVRESLAFEVPQRRAGGPPEENR